MEDLEFLDVIYQHWAKTTVAEDTYWMPEQIEDSQLFNIFAVSQDQSRKLIASQLSDEDADFITAIHGCLPDLVRRMHNAIDEADRKDYEKDELEGRLAELELAADFKDGQISDLESEIDRLSTEVDFQKSQVREIESWLSEKDDEINDLHGQIDQLKRGDV